MKTQILSIFTRTPLHVGAGSSVGAVDQPIVRERHTGYPVIPGSAIKGVLADLWLERNEDGSLKLVDNKKGGKDSVRDKDGIEILGSTDTDRAKAGSLLIGEGKLLAFPVRSAKKCWAWLTCPMVLARLARDLGTELSATVAEGKALASKDVQVAGHVIFEEYPLEVSGDVPEACRKAMAKLVDDQLWQENVEGHLAVVGDELFAYFVKNACEIANHNRIDDETGVVDDGALFSQENVPSEALFYSMLNTKREADFVKLTEKLAGEKHLLQIGADMTTGLGWCSVVLKSVNA